MLCVYAVVAATRSRSVAGTGMRGGRLRVVRAGTVAAVAEEQARRVSPTLANLRAYDAVIRSIFEQSPALLPVRFGTCTSDVEELMFILESRQRSLRTALGLVRGRAQMTVRVAMSSQPSATRAARGTTRPRTATTGTGYLRDRAMAALAARSIPGFESTRIAAARWIKDERVEKRQGIATAYHLVPRKAAAAYRKAIEAAAAKAGLRIAVGGPWPPYAFAAL